MPLEILWCRYRKNIRRLYDVDWITLCVVFAVNPDDLRQDQFHLDHAAVGEQVLVPMLALRLKINWRGLDRLALV